MDFDSAIRAHSEWKMKLSGYLRNPDGSLKPHEIQPDNTCALGQWIHGDGRAYSSLPEFGTLTTAHAHFHTSAADIVRRANSKESVTEEVVLGSKSSYGLASSAVVSAIMHIKSKV